MENIVGDLRKEIASSVEPNIKTIEDLRVETIKSVTEMIKPIEDKVDNIDQNVKKTLADFEDRQSKAFEKMMAVLMEQSTNHQNQIMTQLDDLKNQTNLNKEKVQKVE